MLSPRVGVRNLSLVHCLQNSNKMIKAESELVHTPPTLGNDPRRIS